MFRTKLLAAGLAALAVSPMASAVFDGPAPLAWRWVQPTRANVKGSPVVVGDIVVVAVGDRMFGLDKATGNQKWRFPLVEPIDGNFLGSPAVVGDTLVVNADNKKTYGVDVNTGQEKWVHTADIPLTGSPVATSKYAVVAQSDNSLMAIDVANGNSAWERSVKMLYGISGPIVAYRDDVLVMDNNFQLSSISTGSQKVTWSQKFSTLDPGSVPVVVGDTIFINSGQYLAALRGGSGKPNWQVPLGSVVRVAPAISGEGVFVINQDGQADFYNMSGRKQTKVPIALGAYPLAGAAVAGKQFIVPTTNGAINLVDPTTGAINWTYIIRPLGPIYTTTASGSTGGTPGRGGVGGGATSQTQQRIWTIQPAGTPVIAGDTLLVLARDGSLLAFDKNTGVDLTGPRVSMLWPNAGDQVSGDQLELMFKLDDEASGINDKTIAITANGQPLEYTMGRDGIAVVRFSRSSGKNRPLGNGRATFQVNATDWLGNKTTQEYVLTIDNSLRPLVRPGSLGTAGQPGTAPGGGGPSIGGPAGIGGR